MKNLHPAFVETNIKVNQAKEPVVNPLGPKIGGTSPPPVLTKTCSCNTPSSSTPPGTSSSTPPDPNSSGSTPSSGPCADGGNPYDNISSSSSKPPGASSTNSSSSSTSTSSASSSSIPCTISTKATNAVGTLGPTNFQITNAPYKVYSCDQVLVVDGFTFIDQRDFTKRKSQVFTLSLFMINQFDTKDGKTMNNHILLENIVDLPDRIQGAPTCIMFLDGKTKNRIVMCLPNISTALAIKKAYMDLLKCRIGMSFTYGNGTENIAGNPLEAKANSLNIGAGSGSEVTSDDISKVFKAACLGVELEGFSDDSGVAKALSFLAPFLPPVKKSTGNLKGWTGVNPAYGKKVPGTR